MTLNSDFNLGDEVYFMCNNKVCKEKIISVQVFNNGMHQREEYGLTGVPGMFMLNRLFKTKQDLLDSL